MISTKIMLFFGTAVIASFFYWEIFHRVCVRALRFKLFALRDEARRLACDKKLGDSEEFKTLEQFICLTIAYIPNISLFSFVLHTSPTLSAADKEEFAKFDREAQPEFLDIRNGACRCAIVMMTLNSPWLFLAGSIPILSLWAIGRISGIMLYRKTESFVEGLPPAPFLKLPSAMVA
jgi:hypothetical protein